MLSPALPTSTYYLNSKCWKNPWVSRATANGTTFECSDVDPAGNMNWLW
jgi:hypothetical protein